MERFIPVECFRKKGNTFRGVPFFSLLPEFPEISVPFVHIYQCQAPHENTSERMLKMAADFQNVYRCNVCLFSSVVLADVLGHNCNPAGEKQLSFAVSFVFGTCVFLLLS